MGNTTAKSSAVYSILLGLMVALLGACESSGKVAETVSAKAADVVAAPFIFKDGFEVFDQKLSHNEKNEQNKKTGAWNERLI